MPHSISAVTRRSFLLGTGALAASAALPVMSFAGPGGNARLVVIILRGALDGLAAVPPFGDLAYADLHQELAIGAPGSTEGALPLDGIFGLHPAMKFLHERYAAGELIVFHAVSSPYRDRSHFDGQNVLENGLTKPIGSSDGWLNRALAALPMAGGNTLAGGSAGAGGSLQRAVAVSQNVPLILRGASPVVSKSPQLTPNVDEDLLARLQDLYSKDDWFSARLSEAMQTDRMVEADASAAAPPGATPGDRGADRISASAHMAAALLRSEGGARVAVFEATGWDTHANQGGARGVLAQRLGSLDGALRVLSENLGPIWRDTAVLVMTEFGRTAAVNGTRGTDHGTGSCAFLAGGAVRGGRVLADWPGLSRSALLDGRDLRPTSDLRSISKAVLSEHLRVDAQSLEAQVFPDSKSARPLRDLMRA